MKKFKKLFELQTGLTSFTYPVVKIIICLLVIVLCLMRNKIFQFSNNLVNLIVTLLCFLLVIASVLCLYISVGEVFHTVENRKSSNCKLQNIKQLPIEVISKMVSENDIVEIEVCKDRKIIKIGASSECEYTSTVFKNKLFYITSSEYETLELFTEALLEFFPEGSIPVLRIDGLPYDKI